MNKYSDVLKSDAQRVRTTVPMGHGLEPIYRASTCSPSFLQGYGRYTFDCLHLDIVLWNTQNAPLFYVPGKKLPALRCRAGSVFVKRCMADPRLKMFFSCYHRAYVEALKDVEDEDAWCEVVDSLNQIINRTVPKGYSVS